MATPSEVANVVGKAYRTLHAYREGTRKVPLEVAKKLSRYLRRRASAMLKAADRLDSHIKREEDRNA